MATHILLSFMFASSFLLTFCTANHAKFRHCMSIHSSPEYDKSFKYIHTPRSGSYLKLLRSAEQNPRWLNSTALKPNFIVTPYSSDEIRATILCSRKHGFQIRVKSGGHDYEGLSYLCGSPFVIVDLINLRSISVNLEEETAWVQSGATIGELYYSISMKSSVHGFPAGLCPSVGVGGHFSGGGFGTMLRKHGLAADNILDAYFMDANGKIFNRESMGEDLFWAIRGGGGGSFGIILAWKVKLVRVPPVVTVFTIHKTTDKQGIKLVNRWQHVANKLPEDLFIRIVLQHIKGNIKDGEKTAELLIESLFLGPASELVPLMKNNFPELGLKQKDCVEMSWIESVLYFAGFKRDDPLELLLDRTVQYKSYFKAKSDFATKTIPENVFIEIRERLLEEEIAFVIMDPFGGKMEQIPRGGLPFPHRKGNLFNIQYLVKWSEEGESKKRIEWIRMLYEYMRPYVSGDPRSAYLNYRDVDIGINEQENTSYSEAVIWGTKYFKGNFRRLAKVKKLADPENFFRHEQSIPLIS